MHLIDFETAVSKRQKSERRRARRACLNCSRARTKCDVISEDSLEKCRRCERLGSECRFKIFEASSNEGLKGVMYSGLSSKCIRNGNVAHVPQQNRCFRRSAQDSPKDPENDKSDLNFCADITQAESIREATPTFNAPAQSCLIRQCTQDKASVLTVAFVNLQSLRATSEPPPVELLREFLFSSVAGADLSSLGEVLMTAAQHGHSLESLLGGTAALETLVGLMNAQVRSGGLFPGYQTSIPPIVLEAVEEHAVPSAAKWVHDQEHSSGAILPMCILIHKAENGHRTILTNQCFHSHIADRTTLQVTAVVCSLLIP